MGARRWLIRPEALRRHRNVFVAAVGVLTLANVALGGGWWSFWPLFGWGIAFLFHLCLVRAIHVRDEWVDERTDDLRLKSYDLSHIEDIDQRYNPGVRLGATRGDRTTRRPVEHRYPIVDAHHHLWDLERNYYPWLRDEPLVAGRHRDYRAIRRTYLPDDFRRDWGALNVAASVHVEAEWDRSDEVGETRWLHEIHARHGLPSAIVAHARLADGDVAAVLEAHRGFPLVRGIRDKPAAAPSPDAVVRGASGSMSDPLWRAGYARLASFGFSFDLQVPYWHLPEAAELARDFPRTLLIVDHTGLPTHRDEAGLARWRDALGTVAAQPNAVIKISGLGEPHLQPWTIDKHLRVVLDTIDVFGVERAMFASNYPVERLYAPYEAIMRGFMEMTRSFSLGQRRMLFHDNARHYYRIER